MKKIVLMFVGTALVAMTGCELIVDFDRSKIPQEGTDASVQDVTQPPVSDAAQDVSTSDAATDATPSDAAPDTGTDAGSDANLDAAADADGV